MSILKIEPGAINANADFSLGSLSVTGNINVGAATIAATESGDLAFTTANGTFDITANTVNFLNTVATTEIAPGGSIVTESPTPRIISVAYVGNDTAAAVAGGETLTITGSGFNYGASVYISGAIVAVVTVIGPTQITFTSPARAAGNYTLGVVNPDGASATFVPGIQYSGVPAWSTASGSLGAHLSSTAFSTTLTATSDSVVSYSIVSGSLPPGVTLNTSTGVVAGTLPAVTQSTTYNFTVSANDAENQSTDRNFSINVTAPAVAGQEQFVTAGTYSWTVPAGVTSVSVLCVGAGAGEGAGTVGGLSSFAPISDPAGTLTAGGGQKPTGGAGTTLGSALSTGIVGGGNGGSGGATSGQNKGGGGAGGYGGNGGNGNNTIYAGAAGGGVGLLGGTGAGGGGGSNTGEGIRIRGAGASGGQGGGNTPTGGIYGGGAGTGDGGVATGSGGGGLRYVTSYAVTPGSAFTVVVGAGGAGGSGTGGGRGAVRIIWGTGRAFPSTNTSNV